MITLLKQPKPSKTCGHHCVAMIVNVPVEDIIHKIGHTKGTFDHELCDVLHQYGYETHVSSFKNEKYLSKICILGIRWKENRGGHWRLLYDGMVYDPSFTEPFPFEWKGHRQDGYYHKVININKSL